MRSFSVFLISLLGGAAMVSAECCSSPAYCLDGRESSIWDCCAYGSCNIFCCNCDGGCITGPAKRSWEDWANHGPGHLPGLSDASSDCGLTRDDNQCVLDKIAELDTDHDGKVTLANILANPDVVRPGLSESGLSLAEIVGNLTKLFEIFDTSEDGYLVYDEANTPQPAKI
ncbi:hypothetical protein PV10_06071 [Exophiala mesophila]|uniref:EF-hand domain-containing protein n=1 Tax=Exophiala mesophila TaxID=212818 RepID=A0A0D1ZA54_EXOME|nr:uncharacterized protein PV10_06071 [Exophiala mesophila]KIV91542.1 hypothetical protein PV10_06071 [Exophiala mesophila]